ncbi:MAG: hypothetical protein JO159_05235 [Acidobacteria bacterium]|nr:hypothetical protein [Acidobacteriota bacterium]MBV9622727.1 hypothetical protein [Acidobacteriota bacterium]
MRHAALTFAILASSFVPGVSQKIEKENADRSRVVHLKTALDHLTVIELREPVLQVASGSPAFKIEWRENKVFIQPTEADTATNLFIWTASQRLNYELEPAGSVAEMDFAVDRDPPPSTPASASNTRPERNVADLLLEAQPVRMMPGNHDRLKLVDVWISDVYQKQGQLLVRYTVFNHGQRAYAIDVPRVFQLDAIRSPQSLYNLVNSQLDDRQASRLRPKRRMRVNVLDQKMEADSIAPGEHATGIVSLEVQRNREPTVLCFQFPRAREAAASEGERRVNAFLVR